MKKLLIISALILSVFKVSAQTIIPAKNASKYLGKNVTICETVFSTEVKNESIILYLGGNYPNQLLAVVIKSSDRKNFKGKPDIDFKGKDVCVTGKVTGDTGKPVIFISSSKQIHFVLVDTPVKSKSSLN
jgi:hypothetical protein